MKIALTAERLREVLHYDPDTGLFLWRKKTGTKSAGAGAGTPHKEYIRIQIDRKLYRAHRLAWLYMTGAWPATELDHRNTVGTDNWWNNLRLANRFTNMQNQRTAHVSNHTTGLLGAHRQGDRFRARIRYRGRGKSLGMFPTAQLAHAAYVNAKRKLHAGCTL